MIFLRILREREIMMNIFNLGLRIRDNAIKQFIHAHVIRQLKFKFE